MTDGGLGLLLGAAGLGLGFFLGSLHGQLSPASGASRPGVVAEAFEAVARLDRPAGRLTAESPARAAGPDRRAAGDVTGAVPTAQEAIPQIVCRQVGALASGEAAGFLLRR